MPMTKVIGRETGVGYLAEYISPQEFLPAGSRPNYGRTTSKEIKRQPGQDSIPR
jgi:hypothetical protein